MFQRSLFTTILLAAVGDPALAQTFIVDVNGGPGTHYKDLAKAVAAVPSGAVLRVRAGDYPSDFAFANKSLSIIGDSLAVKVKGRVAIGPLRAQDRVLIANLNMQAVFRPYLRVYQSSGVVVLKDVGVSPGQLGGVASPKYEFTSCANVQILDSQLGGPVLFSQSSGQASHTAFVGQDSWPSFGGGWVDLPTPAIRQKGGRVHLTACTVTGGQGWLSPHCGFPRDLPGTHGASALIAEGGADVTLFRCTVAGGSGSRAQAPCSPAKNGGHGLVVSASTATALGCGLFGGNGGAGGGQAGQPVVWDAASTVVVDATKLPAVADIEGQVIPGRGVQLTVGAKPGSVGLLLLGLDTTILPLAPVGLGNVYCVPSIILGQFVVPGTGTLKIPVTIPAGWVRDVPTYGQFLTLQTGPILLWGSNPILLLARS